MGSLDRSHHGWEGISNGGEIYENKNNSSKEFPDFFKQKLDCLCSMQECLKKINSEDVEIAKQAAERMKYLQEYFSFLSSEESRLKAEYDKMFLIKGDGSEIKAILDNLDTNEELESSKFRR